MTKISFISKADGELFIDGDKVATITANSPCEFELPKGAYQFCFNQKPIEDDDDLWYPQEFDLRLNGSGSVDIRREDWNEVHIISHTTTIGDVLFTDVMSECENDAENDPNPEVDADMRNVRMEKLKSSYDKVIPFNEALMIVVREDRYGLYDLNRERLVQPVKYQKIWSATPEYAIIQQDNLCGLLSPEGEKLTPIKYSWIEANTTARLIRVSMGSYTSPDSWFGLVDRSGMEIPLAQHTNIYSPEGDLFTLEDFDMCSDTPIHTYGFYNERSGEYIRPKYDQVGTLYYNRMPVCRDGLWGYVDGKGHEIIAPRFRQVWNFISKGFALVELDDLFGVIDRQGNYIVQPEYRTIEATAEYWVAAYTESDKCRLINLQTGHIMPTIYDRVEYLNNRVMIFKRGEQWGLLDMEARETLIAASYDDLTPHNDYLILARRGEQVGLLDLQGKEVLPVTYSQIGACRDGLFWVATPNEDDSLSLHKWRCIDAQGNDKTPRGYKECYESLEAGVFRVYDGIKEGLCDLQGNEIIPPTFDSIYEFHHGVAVVCRNGHMGAIDASGNIVVPIIYDNLWNFLHDTTLACRDGKWGAVDRTGREVIPCRYQSTDSRIRNGYAKVGITALAMTDPDNPELMDNFVGYVNKSGEEIRFTREIPCYCDADETPDPNLDGRDIFLN